MRIVIDIDDNISFDNIQQIQQLVAQWVSIPVHITVCGNFETMPTEIELHPYVNLDNPYARRRKEQLHYKTLEKRKREV